MKTKTTKNITIQLVFDYIKKIIPQDCQLRVNKVKAHTGERDARSYVNYLVDKAARIKMKEARKVVKNASANTNDL